MFHTLEKIQSWVQSGPMGNDKQWLPQVIGMGVSVLGALKGQKEAKAVDPLSPDDLRPHFADSQGTIGQMQQHQAEMAGYGRQLMDPTSRMNRQQQQMLQQRSMDQVALQSLLARRQAAASGQSSGVTAAQTRMASGQASRDAMGQFNQSMLQNRQQGLGVLGQSGGMLSNVLQGQMNIGENLAQAALAQRQQQMQAAQSQGDMWSSVMGGIGSGLMGLQGSGEGSWTVPNTGGGSDIALKENIDLIGKSPSGINIYEFDYKNKSYGNGRYRGVMAQEVPNASFRHKDGYLWVDYNKVDVDFERID